MRADFMPRRRLWRASEKGREESESPGRLLRGAVANHRKAFIGTDNCLRGAAAVDEAAENEMKIRIAGMLSKDDEIDLIRVELQRGVGSGDHLLAVLLFHALADGQDAHIGEDRLRNLTSTPRALVDSSSRARRTTSTRSFGRMKPPAVESPSLSILIATARFPVGRIADMNPPAPA